MRSLADLLERDCVVLVESTIPADMTIAHWRRVQARQRIGTRRGPRRRRLREWGR
jgi:hypothetical protein